MSKLPSPLRIAAIRFLNPAPLMWDFEHEPQRSRLALNYSLEWMMPAQCAERLSLPAQDSRAADIGLIPVAALATTPGLVVLPGCAIAATRRVRSILLVRRATQPLSAIRTVAADTSSRASLAYTEVLFRHWWQPNTSGPEFLQHPPDLDPMLDHADAALLIGDPALYALEERQNREERSGEELVYHDLAAEWIALTGLPWVSAVWAIRQSALDASPRSLDAIESIASDFIASRDHGLANIESLVEEWSARLPLNPQTIRTYLTENIHYALDEPCMAGLRLFYKLAAQHGILPEYQL